MRCHLAALLVVPVFALAACGGSKEVKASGYTCGQFNKSLRTKADNTAGSYINQLRKQAKLGQSAKIARADGARIEDVDGKSYIDFAGGLGCQNLGHGFGPAVDAMRAQLDQYLHQCFMVGMYEPYIETCRRLNEHSPCSGSEQRSLLLNAGAEAVENAVKIARAYTGRSGVICFDHGFHGRTILTLAMTSKVVPYKNDIGPLAPEVFRAPAPYPYRDVDTDH